MSGFRPERRAWARLRDHCPPAAKGEYELAVSTLIERYNTAIYENRFTVGGAVELLTYALLQSAGTGCSPHADQSTGGDILLPKGQQISLKSSFRGGPQTVRIMNKMGAGKREWNIATLFVVSEVGIVYGDPDMVDKARIQDKGDGLDLHKQGLASLIADPANVLAMDIVRKPGAEMTANSRKASTALVKDVLQEMQSKILLDAIR